MKKKKKIYCPNKMNKYLIKFIIRKIHVILEIVYKTLIDKI